MKCTCGQQELTWKAESLSCGDGVIHRADAPCHYVEGLQVNNENQPAPTPETDAESEGNYFSDTPETNSLIQELKKPSDGDRMDMVSLARKLERERDEAKLELENCKSHFAVHNGQEPDEPVHMAVLHILAERDQLRTLSASMQTERDEARAQAERYLTRIQMVEEYQINDTLRTERDQLRVDLAVETDRHLHWRKAHEHCSESREVLIAERDQLRKVCDELAVSLLNCSPMEHYPSPSWDKESDKRHHALAAYNELKGKQ